MSPLARLSPFGPIFTKELRVGSRRKRTYILRVGYLALLLLALLWAYAATDRSYGGVAAQAERQQSLGYAFFIAFSIVLVGTVPIVSPVLTSNAIGGERLARTLPVLLMTPITAWQVVGGKLFSRLLSVLMLIGLGLPVLAMVRLLGGVELEQMGAVIALAVSFAFACAAIGLFYSLFISRPAFVILLSYATMGVIYGVLPICASMFMAATRSPPGIGTMTTAAAVNPAVGLTGILVPPTFLPTRSLWVWSVGGQLLLGCVLTAWTASLLRKQIRKQSERPVGATEQPIAADPLPTPLPASLPSPGLPPPLPPPAGSALPSVAVSPPLPTMGAAIPAMPSGQVDRRRASASVSDNPVLWREMRRPLLKKPWHIALAIGLFGGIMGVLYISTAAAGVMDEPSLQIFFAEVFLFIWWLLSAILAGTSSTSEKETDTWTLLLATPLSGGQIVWAKFVGVMRRMWIPTTIVAVHFLMFVLGGVIPFWSFLAIVFLIVSTGTLWIAAGVALSLWARRMTVAVICGLMPAVLLYGVLPLAVLIPAELVSRRGEKAAAHTLWVNPYFFAGSLFDGVRRQERYNGYTYDIDSTYYRRSFELPKGRGSAGQMAAAIFACGLVHLAGAAAVLSWASRVFDPLAGRAGRRRSVGLLDETSPSSDAEPSAAESPVAAGGAVSPVRSAVDQPTADAPGLLRRLVAHVIDAGMVQCIITAVMLLATLIQLLADDDHDLTEMQVRKMFEQSMVNSVLVCIATGWLILAVLESSRLRATVGKWMLGMHVCNRDGHRVPLAKSLLRNLLKTITLLPLGLGGWMALANPGRRALYDTASDTCVKLR